MSSDTIHVFKHTRDLECYSDSYDKATIGECRYYIEHITPEEMINEVVKNDDGTEMSLEKKRDQFARCLHIVLYTIKGERYVAKEATIKKWVDRDKELDGRLAVAPVKVTHCNVCGQTMNCISKDYHDADYKRILLMYTCPDCKKVRAFYDDGEEYVPRSNCAKCGGANKTKSEKDDKRILITDTCIVCGHVDTYELSLAKEEPEDEKKKEAERRQFLADRENFCFSEEQGNEYIDFKRRLAIIGEMMDKEKEKEKNKELYDELAKIQKLNITQLNKLLGEGLAKENYISLQFSNPEMIKDVMLGFTIQENNPDRKEYDSRQQLKKLMEKLLFNTNWKLMSDGVSARLGILSGRLRGFEAEEDLLELVKKRFEK